MSKKKSLASGVIIVSALILALHLYRNRPLKTPAPASPTATTPLVELSEIDVDYTDTQIRLSLTLTNRSERPVRKIMLQYKVYSEGEERKLVAERIVTATWKQDFLRAIINLRKKLNRMGRLDPEETVTTGITLSVPEDLPQMTKVRSFVKYMSAEFDEN